MFEILELIKTTKIINNEIVEGATVKFISENNKKCSHFLTMEEYNNIILNLLEIKSYNDLRNNYIF